MSGSPRRERAEAAFGHLQQAAGEMIAAAQDALGIVEEAVSTAGFDDLLDAVDHLSRSVFSWARPEGHRPSPAPPSADPSTHEGRHPARDPARDPAGDPTGDPARDPARDPRRDQARDPSWDEARDQARDEARDPVQTRRPPPGDGPVQRIPVR